MQKPLQIPTARKRASHSEWRLCMEVVQWLVQRRDLSLPKMKDPRPFRWMKPFAFRPSPWLISKNLMVKMNAWGKRWLLVHVDALRRKRFTVTLLQSEHRDFVVLRFQVTALALAIWYQWRAVPNSRYQEKNRCQLRHLKALVRHLCHNAVFAVLPLRVFDKRDVSAFMSKFFRKQ